MTLILLFKPSTKPKETLSSDWMKTAIPSQWLSIIWAGSDKAFFLDLAAHPRPIIDRIDDLPRLSGVSDHIHLFPLLF